MTQKLPVAFDLETVPFAPTERLEQEFKRSIFQSEVKLRFEDPTSYTPEDEETFRRGVYEEPEELTQLKEVWDPSTPPSSEAHTFFAENVYVPHKSLKDETKKLKHYEEKAEEFFSKYHNHYEKARNIFFMKLTEEYVSQWNKFLNDRKFYPGGAQIVSAAFAIVQDGSIHRLEGHCAVNEAEVAEFACDYLNSVRTSNLVGYNSRRFDTPQLASLFSRHNKRLEARIGKWDGIDLYEDHFKRIGYKIGLKQAIGLYGIQREIPDVDGSAVEGMFKAGDLDQIKAYNLEDVRITGELAIEINRTYYLF